ncbi:hypothetical protein ANN_12610 [Periplaneta americana]|uniref:Uncharacterized protein n=1 Tax=Periplaneta americana TaxID=6978 RepID=A0ABQ8TJ81_PERAM|nr:hypothetical protein ANN_12610 [Periplaneta americana]
MLEEAQEARYKHLKQFREQYARKISREATNRDVFNRLLATSDPFITSFRQENRTKYKKRMPHVEVINLLSSETNKGRLRPTASAVTTFGGEDSTNTSNSDQ